MSTNTIQPFDQLAGLPEQVDVLLAAKLQIDTVIERRIASERAKRISDTSAEAAAWTDLFIIIVLIIRPRGIGGMLDKARK